MLRSWNSMISKKILPERAAISFPHSFSLTHTLFKLESVSSVCQFSLIENSLGQNQWELIGSGSVFLRNVFSGAQGFYVWMLGQCRANMLEWFDHLGHSAELCLATSRSSDPQNYKSFNISLYIRSLIGSEVKAVCCTEKTSWPVSQGFPDR